MSARRPGRAGLVWLLFALLALGAAFDVLRGRDSLLLGWWADVPVTPAEQGRTLRDRIRVRLWGR